jgi:2-polyprenyl-3-methyl-5-hydroxy-6-metoxy-1,4-benzoquinol methylase
MTDRCPLCNESAVFYAKATDIEYFTTPQEFDFYHCTGCDILFISPMLIDQLSLIYPPTYYAFDESAKESAAWRVKGWLDRRLLRGIVSRIAGTTLSVLDIGGGTGWMASAARDADKRVDKTLIIDLDSGAKDHAEAMGHRFFFGRVEDFDTAEKFDLILMLNLIEHVPHPDRIMEHASRLLSSQGRILIQTPNFKSFDAAIFRHRSWGGYHCPRHFVLFCADSINRMLKSNGLTAETFRYTQGATFWATSLMHEMATRGLISAGPHRFYHKHPLAPFVQMAAAALDMARRPFAKTSQMVIVAKRAAGPSPPENAGESADAGA